MIEVDPSVLLNWITQIAVVVGSVTAFVVWFRKWIRKQVSEPMKKITDNVVPNGGNQSTSRYLIEEIHREVGTLQSSHATLTATSVANRELGEKALRVAEKALTVANEALEASKRVNAITSDSPPL